MPGPTYWGWIYDAEWALEGATEAHHRTEARLYRAKDANLLQGHGIAPHRDCNCGIYAFHRPPQLDDITKFSARMSIPTRAPDPLSKPEAVAGAMIAWGKIQVHVEGFRAQYARPVAFVNRDELGNLIGPVARSLAERLGLPVIQREHIERYAAEFGQVRPA